MLITTRLHNNRSTSPMSHVSSANYPMSKPLSTLIRATIQRSENKESRPTASSDQGSENNGQEKRLLPPLSLELDVESKTDALQHFVRNCFVAIDNLLFAT